jgi:DNA-binding response OmpR family regulator
MMISGHDFSTERAILFGADDLLPKPLVTEYLLLQIDMHLYPQNRNKFLPLIVED